jgi:hypothetical protein
MSMLKLTDKHYSLLFKYVSYKQMSFIALGRPFGLSELFSLKVHLHASFHTAFLLCIFAVCEFVLASENALKRKLEV